MLTGVILAGGKSSRMGSDKAFISHHNHPAWYKIYSLLKSYCPSIYISCQTHQRERFLEDPLISEIYLIADEEKYAGAGPISGLLSVHQRLGQDLFIIACDYLNLRDEDLHLLHTNYLSNHTSICFKSKHNYPEPLVAIYTFKDINQMQDEFLAHQIFSIKDYILQHHVQMISPIDDTHIISFDTYESLQKINPNQ